MPRTPKQLIKALERHKAALARHRDALSEIEQECAEYGEISRAAEEALEEAIARISEQL